MTLVDSCVLIDVIESDARWADWSTSQLETLSLRGALTINLVIYAELAKSFGKPETLDEFLADARIGLASISTRVAFKAAQAHLAYRRNKGTQATTLSDFFIGAHAEHQRWPILTRDAPRFRTYFPSVHLITPDATP